MRVARSADGKLLTLDLAITVWGVRVQVAGTVEILDIRADLEQRRRAA